MRKVIVLVVLVLAAIIPNFGPRGAVAVSNPVMFRLGADFNAWNFSTVANPALTEFRGVQFTASIFWVNSEHTFAIYTKGFPAGSVRLSDLCSLSNTNGCLKATTLITATNTPVAFTFTPTIPPDDFSGLGTYEYYCQIHPDLMHGRITLYKSPDILNRGKVDIVDAATLAFAFDSTPVNPTWNVAADLDNSGKITIVDAAILAFYFDQPF